MPGQVKPAKQCRWQAAGAMRWQFLAQRPQRTGNRIGLFVVTHQPEGLLDTIIVEDRGFIAVTKKSMQRHIMSLPDLSKSRGAIILCQNVVDIWVVGNELSLILVEVGHLNCVLKPQKSLARRERMTPNGGDGFRYRKSRVPLGTSLETSGQRLPWQEWNELHHQDARALENYEIPEIGGDRSTVGRMKAGWRIIV